MTKSGELKRSWPGRLSLGLLAVSAVGLAVLTWSAGARMTLLRERGYPIPEAKCSKADECDQRSLQIEAREAVTADGAFDVALGQLVLSIFGIAGVGYTVFYAREAYVQARRAADVAETAFRELERPFLSFQLATNGVVVSKEQISFGRTTYQLRNVGRTVAIMTQQHFVFDQCDSAPAPIDPAQVRRGQLAFGAGVIAPGECAPEIAVPAATPLYSGLGGRGVRGNDLYLLGFVRYRSADKSEYVTGFCLKYDAGNFDFASWVDPVTDEDLYNYDRKLT